MSDDDGKDEILFNLEATGYLHVLQLTENKDVSYRNL